MNQETNIALTLEERGKRYGSFQSQAAISQCIKDAMRQGNWEKLDYDQRECLEMLAHKVARILNGDPNYHDSWHDIVGYAKLVADRLIAGEKLRLIGPTGPIGVTGSVGPKEAPLGLPFLSYERTVNGSVQVVCGEVKRDPISGEAILT